MQHLLLYEDWCAKGSISSQLNEEADFDVSGFLHIVADVAACVADIVEPGSGAIIDLGSLIAYILEAAGAKRQGDQNKFILYSVSALIQFTMLFDPLNIGSALKAQVANVFNWVAKGVVKTGASAAETAALKALEDKLNSLLSGVLPKLGDFISKVSESSIVNSVRSTLSKLGISDFIGWLKEFFTQTLPSAVRSFLQILSKLNTGKLGIEQTSKIEPLIVNGIDLTKTIITSGEKAELGGKTAAKFTGNLISYFTNGFNNSNLKSMPAWQEIKSMRAASDATYIPKPPVPKQ